MAKVEIDLLENSLDSSGDNDNILGMVGDAEGTYESNGCGRSQLICQPIIDRDEENSTHYSFKDISAGSLTYKLVQIPEEQASKMATRSPANGLSNGEFYVINSPVQVFGTTATQKKVTKGQPAVEKVVTNKKRDDKRRATHNEVERRRRDKINTWIGKLAALIPNSGLPDTTSKGGILAKACDYIIELTKTQKRLIKLEKDNDKLVLQILRLNKEISELRNENNSMRLQLAGHCVVTSDPTEGSSS